MTHLMLCQVLNPLANGSFIPGLINLESPFPSPAAAATSHHGVSFNQQVSKLFF